MKNNHLIVLTLALALSAGMAVGQPERFLPAEQARLHPIGLDRPAPDFFDGALLGNGGLGVVVTTRPDAVVLYFAHNNVWDIRLAENNREKIGTFRQIFDRVKAIPDTLDLLTRDPWYAGYSSMTSENYGKPYPRPFPCGSLLLGFDRRNVELTGHRLDISTGLCEVFFLTPDHRKIRLQVMADMAADRLWMRLVDESGQPCKNIFDRIRVFIDPSTPAEFPKASIEEQLPKGMLSFRQILPYSEPDKYNPAAGHPGDKAFRLLAAVDGALGKTSRINWDGNEQGMAFLEGALLNRDAFTGCITLDEGLNTAVGAGYPAGQSPTPEKFIRVLENNRSIWADYWNRSGVVLGDTLLEQVWYRNLYFMNCAAREGANPPGLFANWNYNQIGTAWHGDYHMNYNTQQPYWATFTSNHLEKNLPYVNLVELLMDVSTRWAREYYGLPGAYFPHSAYPVKMTMNPYPVPTWGWEVFETPWTVQGLWWHYLYSGDREFLKARAYAPIHAAVEFLAAYMKRPEARGPQWNDNKYHIFPSVPPELYGLRPGFKYNYDTNADLSLTKFIFKAFQEATRVLGLEEKEKALLADIGDILANYPDYPVARSEKYGPVMVSVPDEHDQVVYNLANALFTVFPGEDHGLRSDPGTMQVLKNSFLNQQNEGGNDLVMLNLQAARIGMLDLERFKRQINYCLLPNGTATLMVLQVHGRYEDTTPYDFMARMGIWFENFGLPAVVNECLMQSWDGTIRLFPNWPKEKDARFQDLRAAGAFLVSASQVGGRIGEIRIKCEAGGRLNLLLPWGSGATVQTGSETLRLDKNLVSMQTTVGQIVVIRP
jgi:hypothetical protein